ncbi:MAG TPA: hypothetical protein VFN91_03060 [Myxococcaceae bacterium]|nr:hypothetical protein [Myxococcaceae bacterium]
MSEQTMRVVLALIAAYHVVTGALALLAPDTFFEQIGKYGVENSHYVGDVGAFTIAYGCGLALAITRPRWRGPILWLGALWYGFHALNHAFDTGEARSEARGWSDTILLALGAVLSGWLARVAERMERGAAR